MPFDPMPGQTFIIDNATYQIAEHPAAPGIAFGQEGRAAVVYKLETAHQSYALKVFKSRFRIPTLASLADQLSPFASLSGLSVCRRVVLTPQRHGALLRENPDLTYSVLMPWIEGPTWLQIVQDRQEITQEQSLLLARSFAEILAELEQQGIAHCDLSAANIILSALVEKGQLDTYAPIELVDVEQLYASNLKRPASVPSGSEGYAHLSVRQGTWEDKADRFAGAVLLAEMLGWCDPKIREAAWGESYFAPQEIQHPCERNTLLCASLADHWGNGVAQLFTSAWNSELLAHCPTFGEWLVTIPESVPPTTSTDKAMENIEAVSDEKGLSDKDPVVEAILALAENLYSQNNLSGALEAFRYASLQLSPEGSNSNYIQEKIQEMEALLSCNTVEPVSRPEITKDLDEEQLPESGFQKAGRLCPFCNKLVEIDILICPYCEQLLEESAGEPKISDLDEPLELPVEEHETEPEGEMVCPKCHSRIPGISTFCPNCNFHIADVFASDEKLKLTPTKTEIDNTMDPSSWLIYLFALIAFVMFILWSLNR